MLTKWTGCQFRQDHNGEKKKTFALIQVKCFSFITSKKKKKKTTKDNNNCLIGMADILRFEKLRIGPSRRKCLALQRRVRKKKKKGATTKLFGLWARHWRIDKDFADPGGHLLGGNSNSSYYEIRLRKSASSCIEILLLIIQYSAFLGWFESLLYFYWTFQWCQFEAGLRQVIAEGRV